MTENNQSDYSRNLGNIMTFVAWIAFFAFLVYAFTRIIYNQDNPNQSVSTLTVDGAKQVTLTRNKYGHYVANGKINGQDVIFLLDTGATDIAMSEKMAKKLQLEQGHPFKVSTANGIVKAHRTRLDSVSLGDIERNNVPGTILKNGPDNQVLLGMVFLKYMDLTQRGNQLTITQRKSAN